jgi:hypothetical protein
MPTTTIKIGHISDDLGQLVNVQSPKPPFQVGVGINSKTYSIADGDYVSGDEVIFEILGSTEIKHAIITTPVGAILAYAESNMSVPRVGKILTLSVVVTVASIKTFIVHNT